MKKLFSLLLSCYCMATMGQNLIGPVSITMPANVPANTADWATVTPPVMIQANVKPDSTRGVPGLVIESKVLVTIKNGGGKVCGSFTNATAPAAGINGLVKLYRGAEVLKLLGQNCTLTPGMYTLCVQFFSMPNGQSKAISEEVCKTFTIGSGSESFSPPQNVMPAADKSLTEQDAKGGVNFRWTPVLPRPKENVTYRLKVWQLMQGQNGTQAMRSNQPIVTKDVDNITQATISNLYTGPCRPPYLCEFVWRVEALSKGQGGGEKSLGSSEATAFKIIITDPSAGCFSLDTTQYKVVCSGFDQSGKPIYHISNLILKNIGTNPGRTGLHNTPATNYITPTGFTVNNLTPPSATGILPGNNIAIGFDIVGAAGTTATFIVNSTITDPANPNLYCDKTIGVTVDLPLCKCDFCDQYKQWAFGQENVTASTTAPFQVNLSTVITAPNIAIVSFKAELISFIHNGKEDCFGCNKNAQTFGNLTGGTFGAWGNGVFPLYGGVTTHHTLTWFGANSTTINLSGSPLNLSFTAPPFNPLGCCDDEIKFCIRYSFTDKECRTCSFVKCYTVNRKHKD